MRLFKVIIIALLLAGCGNGQKGDAGDPGASGATGAEGRTGPKGEDGVIATVVPLCPGVTTYSEVFVEVALCINNSLYAVYSTHGGFLTSLPPGTYRSNAIGSACNLTVGLNCTVSH